VDLDEARSGHRRAAADLEHALRSVIRLEESADDRSLATGVRADHRRYARAVDALFAAVAARPPARAFAIQVERIDPLFASIENKVKVASQDHQREAARAFAEIETSNETTIAAMIVVIPIGLGLLVLIAGLLHASRRREGRARADVTRLELDRLHQMALSDSMTGLKNHRAFHQDLPRELQRREREDSSLALAVVDLDDLKATNDTLGHEAGDAKLRDLAGSLLDALRKSDAAYRIGGDEFAVILPGSDSLGAPRLIRRLEKSLAVSASGARATVGVAVAKDGITKEQLIREADLALIAAKRRQLPAMRYSEDIESLGDDAELQSGGGHPLSIAPPPGS
jgi:diguanylate cyclase (GGDEF)-like protein